ncbi:MAG: phage integrase N-terminal SAM-like domain-containing protein [Alcanivorax sp.]|nr:MAG: phage integrase N-terminal SAM-like domain-containing protein [Alcanivorax sp.]
MYTDSDRRLRLRDQFRDAIRMRHYSPWTEKTYWYWIRYFIRFHKLRPPAELSERKVSVFLSWLALNRGWTAGACFLGPGQ